LLNLIRKLKSPQLTFSFVFSRYSYFHKLLPLLLTGLSDYIQEIQKKSSDLFDKVLSSSNFGQWPTLGPVADTGASGRYLGQWPILGPVADTGASGRHWGQWPTLGPVADTGASGRYLGQWPAGAASSLLAITYYELPSLNKD
jgi:hypothetical protein